MEQREIKAALGREVVWLYRDTVYHGTLSAVRLQRDGERYVYTAEVRDAASNSITVVPLECVTLAGRNEKEADNNG